jgi:SPP1 gp7 family putative phage head morphogenesis protein
VIQTDLLDRFKTGLEGHFKTEAIMALADEINAKTEAAVGLSSIGVPLTVINDRLGLGLDLTGVEGADEPRNPAPALAPVEDHGDQEEPKKPKPAEEEDDTERSIVLPRSWRSTELDSVWRGMVQRVHDLELKAESRWRTHLRNLRDESLGNLESFTKGARRRIVKVTDDSSIPGAAPVFDINDANDEAVVSLEPIWRASMGRGVDTVAEQAGVRIDFHFTDPRVVKLLANRRQDIREVNERMLTELHELLSEGLAQQETEEDLRRRVLDYFGGERANARTVARTETFSAYSGGRFEAMREAEISYHRWVTARDTKVRDSHLALEGERVLVGSPFSNGLVYPLDPSGGAAQVINCRCVTIPEVA